MEIEKLVKELENLKAKETLDRYFCYDGDQMLVAVYQVMPEEDGYIACPKKECSLDKEKGCGRRIKGSKCENINDFCFNRSINDAITNIKLKFKIEG